MAHVIAELAVDAATPIAEPVDIDIASIEHTPVAVAQVVNTDVPAQVASPWAGLIPAAAANDPSVAIEPESGEAVKRSNGDAIREHRASMAYRSVIGARLVRAREATGFTQHEAAREIGYSTPAQLNQWESSKRTPPLSEAVKIADLYGCTVDYLLGRADEMERDPSAGLRRSILRGVRTQLKRCAEVIVDEVDRHARMVGTDSASGREIVDAGAELLGAVQAFMRMNNSVFDGMRGGAAVVLKAEQFEQALHDARRRLRLAQEFDADLRERLSRLPDGDIDLGHIGEQ